VLTLNFCFVPFKLLTVSEKSIKRQINTAKSKFVPPLAWLEPKEVS